MTPALRDGPLEAGLSETLDPNDWDEIRAQGHRMLDDMIDYVANVRERPVWRPIPDEVRARFRAELPRHASDLGAVYQEFPISSRPMRPAMFIPASWDGCMAAARLSACWRKCWRPD